MTTDRIALDNRTGRTLEWHMARARRLQAETLRNGLKNAVSGIRRRIAGRRPNAGAAPGDEDFVCGHI